MRPVNILSVCPEASVVNISLSCCTISFTFFLSDSKTRCPWALRSPSKMLLISSICCRFSLLLLFLFNFFSTFTEESETLWNLNFKLKLELKLTVRVKKDKLKNKNCWNWIFNKTFYQTDMKEFPIQKPFIIFLFSQSFIPNVSDFFWSADLADL